MVEHNAQRMLNFRVEEARKREFQAALVKRGLGYQHVGEAIVSATIDADATKEEREALDILFARADRIKINKGEKAE